MKELISVIVPIYNVEKYLAKCLDSILNQTYRNLEVILVDDGSLDGSSKICDIYAKRDNRIIVVHQRNGGLSVARNRGLEIAKGDFIGFVDSDDIIHNRMYEILYKHIKDYSADISICNYSVVYEGDIIGNKDIADIKESIIICNGHEALYNIGRKLGENTIVAWNKLYKRDLFRNLRYVEGKIHEDEFIVHRIMDKAQIVVYSDLPLYNYLQRDNSIMGSKFNLKRLDMLEALEDRIEFFQEKGYTELYYNAIGSYLNVLITYYYLARQDLEDNLYKTFRKSFMNLYKSIKKDKLTRKTQIKCIVFAISPLLYRILYKIVKVLFSEIKKK